MAPPALALGGQYRGWGLISNKSKGEAMPGLPARVSDYISTLILGQGRYAGQPFPLHTWERKFIRGAFSQPDDAALSLARGGGKTTFTAGLACAAVDVGGPLVEPMGECLVIASSFDQGLICFRHMQQFLRPTFERYGEGKGGRFRVQDSANRATITDGKRAHWCASSALIRADCMARRPGCWCMMRSHSGRLNVSARCWQRSKLAGGKSLAQERSGSARGRTLPTIPLRKPYKAAWAFPDLRSDKR